MVIPIRRRGRRVEHFSLINFILFYLFKRIGATRWATRNTRKTKGEWNFLSNSAISRGVFEFHRRLEIIFHVSLEIDFLIKLFEIFNSSFKKSRDFMVATFKFFLIIQTT